MADTQHPDNTNEPGSPTLGEPVVYLAVGTLRRPHGIRGDLLLDVETDFPERLKPGTVIFVGDARHKLKITRRRPHNDGLLLGFEGITSAEQAARYRAQMVYVPAADRPALPEGEYYHHQIMGLNVVAENGAALGVISDIIVTGSNDVYVVTNPAGKEILLPALKQVLLNIDLPAKTITVHLLPGLVDDVVDEDREA